MLEPTLAFNYTSMNAKRVVQWIVVGLAIALIVFAYIQLSQPPAGKGNTLDVVPTSATLTCTFDGFAKATDELYFFNSLLKSARSGTAMQGWLLALQQLDSLRIANRNWHDLLQTSSLSFQTADGFNPNNWTLSIALPANKSAMEFMQGWMPDLPKRDYQGASLYIGANASWCELRNCLVFSPSSTALEDVAIQTDKNNVLSANDAFNKAYSLRSKDVPLHISSRIGESAWLTLEPVFTSSGTLLNGFLPMSNEQAQPVRLCASSGEMTIQDVLPENTTFLDALHSTEFDSTWGTLSSYYQGSQAELFWSQAWQDLGDSCQCDLNDVMLSWRSGEQGVAVIEIDDSISEAVSFYGVTDSSSVINLLKPILANQPTPADGIYSVAFPQSFMRNAMPSLTVENNFVMQTDGFLFSASSPVPLRAIRSNSSKLSAKKDLASFVNQSGQSSGRFVYQSNNEVLLLPASLSNLLAGCESRSFTTELSQPQQILISIAIPIRIKESAPIQAPAAQEPAAPTEEPIENVNLGERSWSVINHNNQEKETLRNNDKTLELIGSDGKSLWSIEISGPILGDVVQIDALKNNKLQLAFTTQSAVYILDRNGKALPGFPYNTKPPISSPLLLADYDNTKKYRLIFACGDGMLLNIGVDGNPTSGWKFNNTKTEKIIAIKAQKIASDDVLVAVSDQGNVQLLKRTGETKITCTSKLDGFDGKTLDIIAGNDIATTSLVYSCGSSAKTIQLSVE